MYSRSFYIIALLCLFCQLGIGQTEMVWPGDVTNNGKVNQNDFLYIGLAYGATGPARTEISADWPESEQEDGFLVEAWEDNFPNSDINLAHADCNGDGIVNQLDVAAIELNLHEVSSPPSNEQFYQNAPLNNDYILQLVPATNLVMEGDVVPVDLVFGTSSMPIENFYGMSFVIKFNDEIVDATTITYNFDPATAWFSLSDPNFISFYELDDDEDDGEINISYSRTDQTAVNGFGVIANFEFIIEDHVIGLIDFDTLGLVIEDVLLFSPNNTQTVIPNHSVEIVVQGIIDGTTSLEASNIKLSPNPIDTYFVIENYNKHKISNIACYDILGNKINTKGDNSGRFFFEDLIPAGVYFLSLQMDHQTIVKTIVKQ